MKNTLRILPLAALFLTLPACLENEEDIEVHPDGSLRVSVRAHGDLGDFAGGYPVPLDAPWRPAGGDTKRWLSQVGPDTGSAETRARLAEVHWPAKKADEGPKAELAVVREFGSVADWPRWFAPESEPYRTAYMERSARLEIKRQGKSAVYVFERVYHGIDRTRLDPLEQVQEELGELLDRFDEEDPYTQDQWEHIARVVGRTYEDVAERFVRDAIVGVYTQGDAGLSPHALGDVVASVRASVSGLFTLETLRTLHTASLQDHDDLVGEILEGIEAGHREAIRTSLPRALREAGVGDGTLNAILFALEWGFTAFDHYGDLADEDFEVSLRMPGVLVDGNQDEVKGDRAVWHFEGKDLHSGDVVMRAVSVLE